MNNRTNHTPDASIPGSERDFDSFFDTSEMIVEHQSVHEFLQTIPRRWDLDAIGRFGAKIGKTADAMHVSYVTKPNESLGHVRIFPLPLLQWVYTSLAGQFSWPALEMAKPTEEQVNRANHRTKKSLRQLSEKVREPQIAAALSIVLDWMERDAEASAHIRAL